MTPRGSQGLATKITEITEEIGHKGHEDHKGQARRTPFLFVIFVAQNLRAFFFVLFVIFVAQTSVSFVAMDVTHDERGIDPNRPTL